MTRHRSSRSFRVAALAFLLLASAVPASSQEQNGFAKVGGYVGGSFVPKFTLDGETFDGMTAYREVGGDEIGILPKLDKQNMFKGILGYRGQKAALEFSYERTNHNGTFFDGAGEATFQSVDLNGRFFFLTNGRVQPYILVGGGIPWLTVKDGSFLEDEPEAGFGDGSWKGYALNTELGITIYPHPQVGIVVGYGYRAIWFDRATGITDTLYDLRPRFREASKGVVVTGLFTF
jgi:opacity protein-like surface antigen